LVQGDAYPKGEVMKRLAWLVLLGAGWWAATASGANTLTVDEAVKALRDPDAKERQKAVDALASAGMEAAPALKKALKTEKTKEVQIALMKAIARLGPEAGDKETRSELLKLLKNNKDLRDQATLTLASFGKVSAKGFENFLKDKDPEVKRHALLGLGYLGADAKEYTKSISSYLSFRYAKEIRTAAADSLGRIGPGAESAVPGLVKAASDKEVTVKIAATVALCAIAPDDKAATTAASGLIIDEAAWKAAVPIIGKMGKASLPFYIIALKSKDETTRYKVLQTIAGMDPNSLTGEVTQAITPSLKDELPGIRKAAVGVLGKLVVRHPDKAIPLLADALKDKDEGIKAQALAIFNGLGPQMKGSAAKLAELLKENDPAIQKQVLVILTKLGPDALPAAPNMIAALKDHRELLADVVKILDKLGTKVTEAYLDALKNESPMVRQFAAEQIGKLGADAKEAAPALMITLRDKDKAVRGASADALEKIGKGVVPALREQIKDKDPELRAQAIETLGEVGPRAKDALPDIKGALNDQSPKVRLQAAKAIRKIGDTQAAAAEFIKLLGDPDINVRKITAAALEELGADAKDATPGLAKLLKEKDKELRLQAIMTLKSIGPGAKDAVAGLIAIVMDQDVEIRNAAIQTLGRIGPDAKDAIPVLIVLFKDKDEGTRGMAATAVGEIGPAAVPTLVQALKYNDKEVRRGAAIALQNMGPKAKDAVPALAVALKDPDMELRKTAINALKEIGPDAGAALQALLAAAQEPDVDIRSNALLALAGLAPKHKEALVTLTIGLGDKDDVVGSTAVEAMTKLPPPMAVPALIQALKAGKASKIHAAEALERIGAPAKGALPALTEASKDKDDAVRDAVNKAIEKLSK
jgi:HEAT repeat protein